MSSTQQLACTYAALLLADSGKTNVENLLKVTKTAGVEVSKGMATAFANLLQSVNVNELLANVSFAGGAPAAAGAAPAAGAAAPAAAAEAKKEEEEEEDDDMGFGLFD
ncbi:60S acidic ribosomal protein [Trypanosoma rangeli]|uniref:60S acidic ribosomal protein n=1 Tax=Trypanosoma rangeli TaxID=5698 RepID=A0A3R7KRR7_TRYRA|nr:60S acidic ribosomal protein [Trypanosoma rangeli]RNF00034.1 60S acidic ribosomal protein [Trypanosoma rangeli]|eukprot:RNF00034.1 60S acidic ribosomal protein [Trypanosoma rangeli]